MAIPADLVFWLKASGTAATAVGSILLAWRVKALLQWVVYCLVAHEQSISQLRKLADGQAQDKPIVEGVTKHLIDIESKVGLVLLISGFGLLGVGMLLQLITYFIGGG